jgi:pimeloyl-ACP methyl ester carboxylesterase
VRSLRRDGVALFYEEAGGEDPPVLLVHGWCCDHAYFAPSSSVSPDAAGASSPLICAGTGRATSPGNATP